MDYKKIDVFKIADAIQTHLPQFKLKTDWKYNNKGFYDLDSDWHTYDLDGSVIQTFKGSLNGKDIKFSIFSYPSDEHNVSNTEDFVNSIEAQYKREHSQWYSLKDVLNDYSVLANFCKEIKHLSVDKNELFNGLPYKDVAIELKMEKINTKDPTNTFTALYSKDKMAFGNSFPYGDIFTYDSKHTSMLKKICKKYNIPLDIKKVWIHNVYKNLVLINTPGFHFLTLIDRLASDLNRKLNK